MSNPWRNVRFGLIAFFIWMIDLGIYFLYMLEIIGTEQYQLLTWFIVATGIFLLGSYLLNPFEVSRGRVNWNELSAFVIGGFIVAGVFHFALSMLEELTFTWSLLETSGIALFLGLTAAINEEIMKWSLLRIWGEWKPHRWIPGMVGGIGTDVVVSALVVNTLWTVYHVNSYVSASALVWLGLWGSGIIMMAAMKMSNSLLVAILIHAFWNVAVVIKLGTIIMSLLGAVV